MMSHRFKCPLICGAGLLIAMLIAQDIFAEDASAKPFREEEIAALLAPIALYPDQLLAQVLMASTYPFEVIQAHRWAQENTSLEGEELASAATQQPWDTSVQALTAFPDILEMMDEKLDWTQQLGDAFLAQQEEVMAMVQTLRAKAKEEGNLKSDEYMKVVEEPAPAAAADPATSTTTVVPSTTTIVIQQANPEVIYVPSYSPTVVYGPWWYPAYPPYYFPPPVGFYHPVGAAFAWGVAVGVRVSFWHGAWNHGCNWHHGSIDVNRNVNIGGDVNIGSGNRNIDTGNRGQGRGASATSQGGQTWSHDSEHRKGASYRDSATAQKYDKGGSAQASTRNSYRGQSGTSASTRAAGGGSPTLSGGNLGGSSARGTGVSSTQAAPRSGSTSKPQSYGGSSSRPTTPSSANRGGAYSGMSSGSRASSYGSRGSTSRGSGGGRGGGRGGRR